MQSEQSQLKVMISLESRYGTGPKVRFHLEHDEINEVLRANGFTEIQHSFQTDCGMTGYSRNDYKVQDADGEWHYAMEALQGIFKKRVLRMLTAPE